MDDNDKVEHYIEVWKKTIDVQQHFNDIEWRIRGLALTTLTFALGASAVAAKDKTSVGVFAWQLQLSSTILTLGVVLWLAFYFVDQVWYHRLLVGAVKHGIEIEKTIKDLLPGVELTGQISANSPYKIVFGWGKRRKVVGELHSSMKLRVFYFAGIIALSFPAVALQLGVE